MKNNKADFFSEVLTSGFEPKPYAKQRVQILLQEKISPSLHSPIRWALLLVSFLLVIGVGLYLHKPEQNKTFGHTALYAYNYLEAQNFGETSPRGLETRENYIHFE